MTDRRLRVTAWSLFAVCCVGMVVALRGPFYLGALIATAAVVAFAVLSRHH